MDAEENISDEEMEEFLKSNPDLAKEFLEERGISDVKIPYVKYHKSNLSKLLDKLERLPKDLLAIDSKKCRFDIDDEVRQYCKEHNWSVIGGTIYFEEREQPPTKSKAELISEYHTKLDYHKKVIQAIEIELKRLESI